MLEYDVRALTAELRAALRGTATTDAAVLGLYSSDASNYRVVPDLVIVPADVEDLVAATLLTSRAGAPIVLRGGGTSMAGNAIGGDPKRRKMPRNPQVLSAVPAGLAGCGA